MKNFIEFLYPFIAFLLLSFSILISFDVYKSKELDKFLELQTKEAKARYEGARLFPKDISDFVFKQLVDTKEVIEIFKNAYTSDEQKKAEVREKLFYHLSSLYEDLTEYDILQFHFHLPNNESFLRFHRPSKYGDDLTDVRKTIAYVNKNQTSIEGFEEGRIFNGYRFVYPLFDEEGKHIGSVEISHSIESFKQVYQRAFSNIDLEIIIDRNVVQNKVFKDEVEGYSISKINDGFMHSNQIFLNKKVEHAIESMVKENQDLKLKMNEYNNFSLEINHSKHKGIISFIAIQNPATKKQVAYAISFEQSEYLEYFYKDKSLQVKYLLALSLLITLFGYVGIKHYKSVYKKLYEDKLMRIYNRRFFEAYLEESCKKQKRNKSDLTLVMFDIDHFKVINDTWGHDVGDEALIALAKIVKEHIRNSDVFARWGGEEFMLLVESSPRNTLKMAEKLRMSIESITKNVKGIPEFTCSFGIVGLAELENMQIALKAVDEKLYEAKNTGRNKVVI